MQCLCSFKQKGEAAETANNVFHYLTYEGAVDISQVTDSRERHAIECQINEFGQCPKQIFQAPHPRRLVAPSTSQALEMASECFEGVPQPMTWHIRILLATLITENVFDSPLPVETSVCLLD